MILPRSGYVYCGAIMIDNCLVYCLRLQERAPGRNETTEAPGITLSRSTTRRRHSQCREPSLRVNERYPAIRLEGLDAYIKAPGISGENKRWLFRNRHKADKLNRYGFRNFAANQPTGERMLPLACTERAPRTIQSRQTRSPATRQAAIA